MNNAEQVHLLTCRVAKIFAGIPPEIVGACLSDLQATLLAGLQGKGVEQVREKILKQHVKTVRQLIPIIEAELFDVRGRA